MTKEALSTPHAPRPVGAYSQGIMNGGMLFTSGFGPQDPETGAVAKTIGEQTGQVLRNIESVLAAAGASMADIVKTTVHLQHLKRDFAEFNSEYAMCFTEPYPARTTVGSDLYDILVEIDVTVMLPVAP